jgi:exodeoxyribonuclease VIII
MEATKPIPRANTILLDLPFDDYLKLDGVSQSGLKNLDKCPKYYQYEKDNHSETTAMEFGSALHSFVLERKNFEDEYFIADEDIKVKRGKKWDAAVDFAESRNIKVLLNKDYLAICEMEKSLSSNLFFAKTNKADKEASIFWNDNDTGVNCKGRIDGIIKPQNKDDALILFDLKTTRDCGKHEFRKQFFNLKYYLQAAFYMDGYKEITGITPSYFVIFAIEKKEPFLTANYSIHYDSPVIEAGRKEYKKLLNKYGECVKNNNFDVGLENDLDIIEVMPAWYNYKQEEEEES